MLKNFWNFLSSTGIRREYDERECRRITLTNQFSFITVFVTLLSSIHNYLIGDHFSGFLIMAIAILVNAVFLLNRYGLHNAATTFFILLISFTVFYFDSYSGVRSGSYLFYFPVVLTIGFVADFRHKTAMLIHFLFLLALIAVNILTDHRLFANSLMPESMKEQFFFFNLFVSTAIIGFFMYLTISRNMRESAVYERRLNERREAELAVKHALAEKDILLAEIHHRVKNNLAIIASLFNLQISSVENEEAKNILLDSRNRVKSMALIHDRLYKSDSLAHIDFAKYTAELIDEISYSYPTLASRIQVSSAISDIELTVNDAIPCGLILNELLTNCYKHAFCGRSNGSIEISFRNESEKLKLKVKDNGVGLKPGYATGDTLGMIVINSLSEQLEGCSRFTVMDGTCFELEFARP